MREEWNDWCKCLRCSTKYELSYLCALMWVDVPAGGIIMRLYMKVVRLNEKRRKYYERLGI